MGVMKAAGSPRSQSVPRRNVVTGNTAVVVRQL